MPKKSLKINYEHSAKAATSVLPTGVKLVRTLRGHTGWVGDVAWSPDGRMIASPSHDMTLKLWDVDSGECLRTLRGHDDLVNSVAFDPTGRTLASASSDHTVKLWEVDTGRLFHTFEEDEYDWFTSVAFHPESNVLGYATPHNDLVKLWETSTGRQLQGLKHGSGVLSIAFDRTSDLLAVGTVSHGFWLWRTSTGRRQYAYQERGVTVNSVAFDPSGRTLVTGSTNHTVQLWDVISGKLLRTLEGHSTAVDCVTYFGQSDLIASRASWSDKTIRLWRADTGDCVAIIPLSSGGDDINKSGLAFHPHLPLLATTDSDPGISEGEFDHVIRIWELDLSVLLGRTPIIPTSHYVNAKVVLLGDTGVGKSGLSLVLNGKPFEATDSTPGRRVWTFQSKKVRLNKNVKQTRETLLWDLAGQPGYRVIHQLHLNEVAVALVVFDSRSEIDPLAGVRHWERALRLAQQRQGSSIVPMKKFLVSARADRGTVSVSRERLEALLKEFEFDGYFETSAKEGWQIEELRQAIVEGILWESLPEVSSSVLFADIKAFLLEVKKTGRLITPASQLYDEFARAHLEAVASESNLRDQFDTCIGRLENRDLIRRLTFGGYVLLQPELLDAYASAMVNAAKKEPDGLGSVAEDTAVAGQFYVPDEHKVKERGQEQLLLHATVEELVRHDLALRESAEDGRYLVFPSEFIRDYEAAPEPKGKALAVTFEGPVQSLYSTLAVRLGHSGLFTTGRAEMWRNAALFTARAGGKCGLYLHEFEEARGRLVIFYDEHEGQVPSDETRFHFEEFVLAHANRRALDNTVEIVRFFVCVNCGDPVPDSYVKRLRERGVMNFDCPCTGKVSLTEPVERLRFVSKVDAMEQSADRQRDFEMFVESARGETSTPSFTLWAGDERVTLAIVFTDVVGSTALGEELKDMPMNEVRRAHFAQSRRLIEQYNGREIKTIGDSFMAAFRSVEKALDYARALHANSGHPQVQIRAGIHIGPMQVEEDDVFGGAVNFAARVIGAIKGAEIWLSNEAKECLDRGGARNHSQLTWKQHDDVQMKGFIGSFTLWSLSN